MLTSMCPRKTNISMTSLILVSLYWDALELSQQYYHGVPVREMLVRLSFTSAIKALIKKCAPRPFRPTPLSSVAELDACTDRSECFTFCPQHCLPQVMGATVEDYTLSLKLYMRPKGSPDKPMDGLYFFHIKDGIWDREGSSATHSSPESESEGKTLEIALSSPIWPK